MEHQVNCHYCGGVESVEATTTLFCDYRSATPVIVENVPAYVCELCGDTSFSGETVATLKTIDNGTSRPVGRRSFPVFDFERPDPKLQPIDAEDLPQLFFNPTPPLVAWKDILESTVLPSTSIFFPGLVPVFTLLPSSVLSTNDLVDSAFFACTATALPYEITWPEVEHSEFQITYEPPAFTR